MSSTTDVGKLAIELAFEAGNTDKQIKAIDKSIANLEKGFKAGAKGVQDYEKTYTGLDAKIQKTGQQLDLYSTKLTKQKEEYSKLENIVTQQKTKLDELESTLGKGSKEWQQQAELVQKNSEKLNKLGTDVKTTEGNISKLTTELDKAEQEFNDLGTKTQTASEKLADIDSKAELAESEFNKLNATLGTSGTGLKSLKTDMENLESKIDSNKQKISVYEGEIKKLSTELDSNKTKHKDLGDEINKTEIELTEAKKAYGDNSTEAQQLKTKLLALKDQYNDLETEINENEAELNQYQTALNNTEAEVINLSRELNQMPFERVGQSMQQTGEKIKGVGQTLSASVTAPLVAMGTASSVASLDFEKAMAKVSTIADDTVVSYDDMKKAIMDLSNQTGISASAIADDVYNAISAGQSTADAVNFVTESTKLAKAGFADSSQALDVLTTIMNSYGMEADQVGKVSDTLIQIQNKGKTTVGELASTMGKIIPTANATGLSLDQLGAGYALMTSKGIATAETTTYMNSLLNELSKSGTKASDALKNGTGKSFQQLIADGVPLGKVLAMLDDHAKKNKKSLADMFGSAEAGKAALILATEGGNAFNDLLKDMENSAGGTDEAFEKVNDTTGNRLAISFNELKNAGIQMGDALAPVVEALAEGIQALAGWFSSLDEDTQKNVVTFGLIAAAVGPLLIGIGQLIFFGGQAITMLGGLAGGSTAAAGATTGLTGAIGLLTGPVALGALAVALVGLMTYVGDSSNSLLFLQEKFGGLGYIVGAVCEFISGIVQLTFGNLGIAIMGICDVIAAILDGPGGMTVGDAWDKMNARLEINTNEAMGKIVNTTSRGLSQMRAMNETKLGTLVSTTQTMLNQLPAIAEGNYTEAATKMSHHLQVMDSNQLLALTGMNDTTKMLFQGIKESMTVEEKTNEVAFNLQRMKDAGKLDIETMEKDITAAMGTIKDQITNKTKEGADNADINTKDLATKVDTNTKDAATKTDVNTKDLASKADTNTKDAASKTDTNTKDLASKTDTNTKSAANKTDTNTKDLANKVDTNTKTAATKADTNTKDLANKADNNTKDAANKAATNTNNLANKIDANTKDAGTKTDTNTKDLTTKIDTNTKDAVDKADINTKDMADKVGKNAQDMNTVASNQASFMKTNVVISTRDMADAAIANWERIRTAYEKSINGNVNITKTTTNVVRAESTPARAAAREIERISNIQMPRVNIDDYQIRGGFFNSKSTATVRLKENNINLMNNSNNQALEQKLDILIKLMAESAKGSVFNITTPVAEKPSEIIKKAKKLERDLAYGF